MDIRRMKITPDKPFPGNEIELLLYRAVFNNDQTELDAKFRKLFSDHGWSIPWINGVYGFQHFHAEAHEVLGCAAGWVVVQIGGPNGPEIRLTAGDAVLIPAGVAHKNIDSSTDYSILGSYPHGQEPDLRRGSPEEWNEVIKKIALVRLWDRDPITGKRKPEIYSRKAFALAIGESYVPPNGINQTFEIALWLPCFGDVDAEYERLSQLGMRFPTGEPVTFSFGIRNFYVADPEGNLLEIGSTSES